jgi:hypothetical protein
MKYKENILKINNKIFDKNIKNKKIYYKKIKYIIIYIIKK